MKSHELTPFKLRSGNYGQLKQDLHLDTADEIDRLVAEHAQLREAAELACGLLWMVEERPEKVRAAAKALVTALGGPGSPGLKRSIERAIAAGFEADHPDGATSWAGMKS